MMRSPFSFRAVSRANTFAAAMLAVCLGLVPRAMAAGNADAVLSLDGVPATDALDTLAAAPVGGQWKVALRVSGAKYLDSYACELGFDSTVVAPQAGSLSDSVLAPVPFLESRGGTAIWLARPSRGTLSRISIAATLAGSDSSHNPQGSGVLAILVFRVLRQGKSRLEILHPKLLDWQLALDTTMATQSILLSSDTQNGINPHAGPLALDPAKNRPVRDALGRDHGVNGDYLLPGGGGKRFLPGWLILKN
jgi:hypothetical protein